MITDDDVRVAYQDFGSGPATVLAQTLFSHLGAQWEQDLMRRVLERMAANLRLLMFDQRGVGMSDGFVDPPSLAERVLDVKAVMSGAGVKKANLIGHSHGAQIAIGFASEFPDQVERVVLVNSRVGHSAKQRADLLHPDATSKPPTGSVEGTLRRADTFGVELDKSYTYFSPSAGAHPDYLRWLQRFQRLAGSRDVLKRQIESVADIDVVDIAAPVRGPVLVTHVVGDRMHHVGYARLLAELIPDSTLIEFKGEDHDYWLADNWRDIVDAHIRFITEADVQSPSVRRFQVVLFTDIVESTRTSIGSGDDEWHRRLDTHDRISRRIVTRHHGSIIKNTGDGILASFDTPSQAVQAAIHLRDELAETGIRITAGIHAGEVEVRGNDISGAVVNLAARVEQAANDDDIYVTSTITDMLIGSQHAFESVGLYQLKGFDANWPLYRIGDASHRP